MAKYQYNNVIQQNFCGTWEDVSQYACNSQGITSEKHTNTDGSIISLLKHDLKEYKLSGYRTKVVLRRSKIA